NCFRQRDVVRCIDRQREQLSRGIVARMQRAGSALSAKHLGQHGHPPIPILHGAAWSDGMTLPWIGGVKSDALERRVRLPRPLPHAGSRAAGLPTGPAATYAK